MTTSETFSVLFGTLIAAYPDTPILPNTIPVYLAALTDITDSDLARAVVEHIAHSRKFPTIAELRELALAGRYPSEGEAWAEVKRAFQKYGRGKQPSFSNPIITEAMEAIGWRTLCDSTQENEPVDRAHFMRAYRVLVDREMFQRTSFTTILTHLPELNPTNTKPIA